jgi:hypothetical protein
MAASRQLSVKAFSYKERPSHWVTLHYTKDLWLMFLLQLSRLEQHSQNQISRVLTKCCQWKSSWFRRKARVEVLEVEILRNFVAEAPEPKYLEAEDKPFSKCVHILWFWKVKRFKEEPLVFRMAHDGWLTQKDWNKWLISVSLVT